MSAVSVKFFKIFSRTILCFSVSMGGVLFPPTVSLAQLNSICNDRNGYDRLLSWKGGSTSSGGSYGGYYETEICGRLLSNRLGQADFVVEMFGKDGAGAGIFSMNCRNIPNGYWKSSPDFQGLSKSELDRRLNMALRKASRLYC